MLEVFNKLKTEESLLKRIDYSFELNNQLDRIIPQKFKNKYLDRTPVQILMDADNLPENLIAVKNEILNLNNLLLNKMNHFKKYNKLKNYVFNLKRFMEILPRSKKEDIIGDFFYDESVNPDDLMEIGEAFEYLICLFPKKMLKNVSEIPVTLEISNSGYSHYKSDEKKVNICLRDFKKSSALMRLFHEFTHAIEHENEKLLKTEIGYLVHRSKNKKKYFLGDLAEVTNKNVNKELLDVKVYDGKWNNLMSGYVYEGNDLLVTEVLSYNLEFLFLNPIELLLSDPETMLFLYKIFHNKKMSY